MILKDNTYGLNFLVANEIVTKEILSYALC
jgi:hypothetical protein